MASIYVYYSRREIIWRMWDGGRKRRTKKTQIYVYVDTRRVCNVQKHGGGRGVLLCWAICVCFTSTPGMWMGMVRTEERRHVH